MPPPKDNEHLDPDDSSEVDEDTQDLVDKDDREAKSQVEEMLGVGGGTEGSGGGEEEQEEEDQEKEPSEDEFGGEKQEEKEGEEERDGEGEKEEEKKLEGEEGDPLMEAVNRLLERVTEQEQGLAGAVGGGGEEKKEGEEEERKEEKPPVAAKPTPTEEIVKRVFDDMEDDEVKKWSQVLGSMREAVVQDVLGALPQYVDNRVQGYVASSQFRSANTDIESFCEDNPGFKRYIQLVATDVQKSNPKWTFAQVFKETEKEVRKVLGNRLEKYKSSSGDSGIERRKRSMSQRPGGQNVRRRPSKSAKGLQAEIQEQMRLTS